VPKLAPHKKEAIDGPSPMDPTHYSGVIPLEKIISAVISFCVDVAAWVPSLPISRMATPAPPLLLLDVEDNKVLPAKINCQKNSNFVEFMK
jgi:hypothetical protein